MTFTTKEALAQIEALATRQSVLEAAQKGLAEAAFGLLEAVDVAVQAAEVEPGLEPHRVSERPGAGGRRFRSRAPPTVFAGRVVAIGVSRRRMCEHAFGLDSHEHSLRRLAGGRSIQLAGTDPSPRCCKRPSGRGALRR
jgi:hypothetical protein